jgi:nifR3 family TIM-barrel protein
MRALTEENAGAGEGGFALKDLIEPGIFVDEMVAARPFAQSNSAMQKHLQFAPEETFRSMQLYCLDAHFAYLAAKRAAGSKRVDHIDLNFGCPVKKVTSSGGGSAIPWKIGLYTDIVKAVQKGAKDGADSAGIQKLPVSVKFRIGIDDEHVTYMDAGKIASDLGVHAVTLHARTTRDYYSGEAKWEYIAKLREELPKEVLVFGNGDIWSVEDAAKMLQQTKADGVAIGRGATGKPWFFYELAKYFTTGRAKRYNPGLDQVVKTALEHLRMQISYFNLVSRPNATLEETTRFAINDFRTALSLYLKGFRVGSQLKQQLMLASTYEDVESLLYRLDLTQCYPEAVEGKPRGRTRSTKKVYLPSRWLESREINTTSQSALV